jgi:hypothetical protein
MLITLAPVAKVEGDESFRSARNQDQADLHHTDGRSAESKSRSGTTDQATYRSP